MKKDTKIKIINGILILGFIFAIAIGAWIGINLGLRMIGGNWIN